MYKLRFSSNTEEVRYYTEQLLADGKEHSVQEIKDYVEYHSNHGQDFTNGIIAGALRSLVQNSNGKYEIAKRGMYQLVNETEQVRESSVLKNRISKMLNDFCEQLDAACTVNIMNIDRRDLEVAQKTSELIKMLRKVEKEFDMM